MSVANRVDGKRYFKPGGVVKSSSQVDNFQKFKHKKNGVSYPGIVPSSSVLKKAYVYVLSKEKEKKKRYIASLKGSVLCGDHTFKVSFSVYLAYLS